MKGKYLLIVLVVVATVSCKFKEISGNGNFSVRTPEAWIRKDSITLAGRKTVSFYPEVSITGPVFINNIRISSFHYSGAGRYMNALRKDFGKSFIYSEDVGRGIANANGYTARWMQNVLQLIGKSYLVEQRSYFIESGGDIYMITCTAKVKQMSEIENEIKTVLNSFEILR